MKPINLLLIGLMGLFGGPTVAQKMVPHSFRHQAGPRQADTSDRDTSSREQLRFLTQVTQPNTTFLRLYFAGTQLGEGSYLVLEGTDGSRQELRKQDLENWRYSSAYFNGQSVNVSLFAAPSDRNTVTVSGVKVSGESASLTNNARQAAQTNQTARQLAAASDISPVTHPYAKAVGRFTNGTNSFGTGWIAPNGAIVTSVFIYANTVKTESHDVIEFNVPPSIGTTVQHPSPQDQYPVSTAPNEVVSYVTLVPLKLAGKVDLDLMRRGYAILKPLPNSTGLRPGERQQEYFRISTNPRSSDIHDAGNVPVDVLHYGTFPGDSYHGLFRTLRLNQNLLLEQNEHLSVYAGASRDDYVLYGGAGLASSDGSDAGAPITYGESNIAMGLHEVGYTNGPSYAIGFRHDDFRNNLAQFFATKSAYVDLEGLNNQPTGEIHKPYLSVQEAANHAPDGAQVYIARNTYLGPVTFNRPMSLRAPVGKVTLGANPVAARKAAGPTISPHWLDEGPSPSFDRETAEDRRVLAYPNPFREQTEIKYPFAEGGPVSVDIFNSAGVRVATFTPGNAASGPNGVQWNGTDQSGRPVPTGLYLVKVNDGRQTFMMKVLKQ